MIELISDWRKQTPAGETCTKRNSGACEESFPCRASAVCIIATTSLLELSVRFAIISREYIEEKMWPKCLRRAPAVPRSSLNDNACHWKFQSVHTRKSASGPFARLRIEFNLRFRMEFWRDDTSSPLLSPDGVLAKDKHQIEHTARLSVCRPNRASCSALGQTYSTLR